MYWRVSRLIEELRLSHGDEDEIAAALGHRLKRPRLGVLIGRLANAEVEALEDQQRYLTDVTIVTYDEILEDRQARLDR